MAMVLVIISYLKNFVSAYIAGKGAADVAISRGTLESLEVMANKL